MLLVIFNYSILACFIHHNSNVSQCVFILWIGDCSDLQIKGNIVDKWQSWIVNPDLTQSKPVHVVPFLEQFLIRRRDIPGF